jgi:hypothetical protein
MRKLLLLFCCVLPGYATADPCDSIPGAEPLMQAGSAVLLGEIHGTDQGPAMVQQLTCTALEHGLEVIVGLEIPAENQQNLNDYLAGKGTDSDLARLISGTFWQQDYQDGRATQAMTDLIESLRVQSGKRPEQLHVVLLDNPADPDGRDHYMAGRLDSVLDTWPGALAISLTGNIHSQLERGSPFDADYEPMGYRLRDLRPETRITSLEMEHSGGTAWVCLAEGECGVVRLSGYGSGPAPQIGIYDESGDQTAVGYFMVGEISASLPAKDR